MPGLKQTLSLAYFQFISRENIDKSLVEQEQTQEQIMQTCVYSFSVLFYFR